MKWWRFIGGAGETGSAMPATVAPQEDRVLFGIGVFLFAMTFLTGVNTIGKWLAIRGYPGTEIVFARHAVSVLFVLFYAVPRYGLGLFRTQNVGLELLRAGVLSASVLCNFTALAYLPLVITGTISFLGPAMVSVLSIFFLKEAVGWRRWVGIGIAFTGVLIIIRPGSVDFHPAVFIAFGTVFFVSAYTILTRKLAGVDSVFTQQAYVAVFGILVMLPFAPFGWILPATPLEWVLLTLLGVIGGLGHVVYTLAFRYAPAATLAPFSYVQIVYAATASWLIFAQPPDVWFYIGAPLVVAAGLFLWLRERQVAKGARSEGEGLAS